MKALVWSVVERMRREKRGEERRGEKMSHFHYLPRLFSYFGDLYYEWPGGNAWKEMPILLLKPWKHIFFFKEPHIVRGDWECILENSGFYSLASRHASLRARCTEVVWDCQSQEPDTVAQCLFPVQYHIPSTRQAQKPVNWNKIILNFKAVWWRHPPLRYGDVAGS